MALTEEDLKESIGNLREELVARIVALQDIVVDFQNKWEKSTPAPVELELTRHGTRIQSVERRVARLEGTQ